MFRLEDSHTERGQIVFHSAFFSIRAFDTLDEAHPRWADQSALLILQIQMLILSRNTLTDTPRIMFHHIWAPHGPVPFTHKINSLKVLCGESLQSKIRVQRKKGKHREG